MAEVPDVYKRQIMTRSLPAQVYAQKIGCYKTTGTEIGRAHV